MNYRVLDMAQYPRREHFEHFRSMADPYAGLTVDVDITGFLAACKGRSLPFFLCFLYCVGRAANSVPQFRQRILGDDIIEFDSCDTAHTVLRDNGTYSHCRIDCVRPFDEYLPDAVRLQEEAKVKEHLDEWEDAIATLFVSSVPWLRYTEVRQPTPVPADSIPRLVWGKYTDVNGRTTLPVTVLANHALVDGFHMAQFYAALDAELAAFAEGRLSCEN